MSAAPVGSACRHDLLELLKRHSELFRQITRVIIFPPEHYSTLGIHVEHGIQSGFDFLPIVVKRDGVGSLGEHTIGSRTDPVDDTFAIAVKFVLSFQLRTNSVATDGRRTHRHKRLIASIKREITIREFAEVRLRRCVKGIEKISDVCFVDGSDDASPLIYRLQLAHCECSTSTRSAFQRPNNEAPLVLEQACEL